MIDDYEDLEMDNLSKEALDKALKDMQEAADDIYDACTLKYGGNYCPDCD
jgi:hypothetical protein